jgi:hypothetical protein
MAEPCSVGKSLVSTGQFRYNTLFVECDILMISLIPMTIPRNGPSKHLVVRSSMVNAYPSFDLVIPLFISFLMVLKYLVEKDLVFGN